MFTPHLPGDCSRPVPAIKPALHWTQIHFHRDTLPATDTALPHVTQLHQQTVTMTTQPKSKAAPATFEHLPLHLQSHIFTLSTAPPDTCKVAAAITQDLQLAAEWLLTKHKQEQEPLQLLRTGAASKHWRLCA
jgi:hypothetical protein